MILFLPARGWIDGDVCKASALAAELSRELQYEVVCEDEFQLPRLQTAKVLLVEGLSVLNPREKAIAEDFRRVVGAVIAADSGDWLKQTRAQIGVPAVTVRGPATVRSLVRDQPEACSFIC